MLGDVGGFAFSVLVVDRDALGRKSLEAALAGRGISTTPVSSVGEGLAALREESVDAVVVHAVDPDPSGITACRYITESWPETPVVVLSEGGPLGQAVEAFAAGAYDFVVGSIDRMAVAEALEHAAQVGRFRRQMAAGEPEPTPEAERTPTTAEHAERRHLMGVLLAVQGDRDRAASLLGIDRSTLYGRLRFLGVVEEGRTEEHSSLSTLPKGDAPLERAS